VDLPPELDPRSGRRGVDAQADRGEKRVRLGMEDLERHAGARGPLDVDRRRLPEADLEAEVVRERRLDDLLLHLAVERDRELLTTVVLADVDQWVLLRELRERDPQPCTILAPLRHDDGLQRRRGELTLRGRRMGFADR